MSNQWYCWREFMRKLSYQEIFAQRPTLSEISGMPRLPLYCLAENIRSLYNVGSIFRTSDAVMLSHLYLTGFTGFPPRKEIAKTALGAVDSVPWSHIPDSAEAVRRLKQKGIRITALEHTSRSVSYLDHAYQFPFCLVIGNEVDGISETLIQEADVAIEIPMLGLKQSLNVSVAYGVVMFHALNAYQKQFPAP
jgi:tRNA G18 (ribose-2'-O)-methylase SpoU